MIEANEDISLVTERQVRDVEQATEQAKAIAEGREIHPALLAQSQESSAPAIPQSDQPLAQTIQQSAPEKPADPDAAFRHVRLGIVAVIVLVLFLLWFRQRKGRA